MQTLKFRLAEMKDLSDLYHLINRAYRAELARSWTNETQIVSGDRITTEQLSQILQKQNQAEQNSQLLIAELNDQLSYEVMGCVGLQYTKNNAEIGTFCIAPELQNYGYGKQVLNAAELYAIKNKPDLNTYSMWVLNNRIELIEYYERRGYVQTGVTAEYPFDENVGHPLTELHLIEMIKNVP